MLVKNAQGNKEVSIDADVWSELDWSLRNNGIETNESWEEDILAIVVDLKSDKALGILALDVLELTGHISGEERLLLDDCESFKMWTVTE